VLLTLLALNAGRVVPAGSLAGQLWPEDPPGNPGNALQTLVSRLRAELRPSTPSTRPGLATRSTPFSAVVLPNRLTSPVASIAFAVASYRMNPSWTMPLSERAQESVSAAESVCAYGQRLPAATANASLASLAGASCRT
jgi:hypothetical protein